MLKLRASVPVVLSLIAGALVAGAAPAVAQSTIVQPNIVNAVPATNTPDVNNGIVYTVAQVAGTTYIGGSFTSVSNHGSSTTMTANYIAAFNASTGQLISSFAPTLNNAVQTIIPGPAANQIYVGGNFTTANGVSTHVALLNATTGATVSGWAPSSQNGVIQKLAYADNMLFAGGSFTSVGGTAHGALVALNPTTGKVLPYVNLTFSGHHNYGVTCTAGASGCANGTVGIKDMDIDPSGTHLVAIGDFNNVNGEARDQLALINLGATSATLNEDFQTQAYTAACFNGAFDSYVRGVTFSPDGSYFVVVGTGGSGTNTDGTNSSCDAAARWETNASGTDLRPTWINYTGQDTFLSVAITGGVVYVGGHQRWVNNSKGYDYAGPGAVPRPGLAALNPISGIPFTWNPGRNPRGAGTYVIYPTSNGIYIGSDTDYIGNHTYLHKKLAFFPLAGGEGLPADTTPTLPGRVYTAGGFTSTANSPVLYRVDAGGPTIGAIDNGPDWQGDQNDPSTYRNSGSNSAGWGPGETVDSTVPSSTPTSIFDSERWDPGSNGDGAEMHWGFPVPAGETVDVRLYFANRCSCTSGVGQRQFDVAIDGSTFLNHFDIVQAAGDQVGTMRHEVVTSDGEVDIDLSHEVENPLINGIEIVRQSAPTTFPATMYRVNSGGPKIAAIDSGNAADWLADATDTTGTGTPFRSGGNVESWDSPWGGTEDGSVPASTPSDVFSTGRWAPQTYTFPVAPGTPTNVKLFFANNCDCTNTAGARQFNVAIDGNQVLTNYDIVGDVGNRVGTMKKFDVTAPASGQVTVELSNGNADNPLINGVQVDQTGATPAAPAGNPDRFSYRHFDGTTVGAEQNVSTGVAWGSIRGAFMVNGELIYGKGDGNLYERTYDGSSLGGEVLIDPYDDPYWENVDTGSGQTFKGLRSDLSSELPSVTSMFFTNGRLYYTLTGSASMHWRWFEPESGIVGSDEFTVSDGNNWSSIAGAFLSGNKLYFADKATGALSSIGWDGTEATGTPTVVDTTQDWASRGMFILADATTPNQPPVADFTATCSATTTACTLDAGASHDPDGSIRDYAWTYGNSPVEHRPDNTAFSHDFGTAGTYSVSLTVTDNDGATDTKTMQVVVGQTTPVPTFVGANSACAPAATSCGKTVTSVSVPVPAGTAAGDALLLFVTQSKSGTVTSSVPSGWNLLGNNVSSPLETKVYYRAAQASDVGATVSANFSASTRANVTIADYSGANPSSIEAFAKATDSNTTTHTTGTAPVTVDGSMAVSYWADKSSTTTAWTLPGSVTLRSAQYDTGAGYDTSVLADSGSTVASGTYGGKTATTNAASGKADEWTIILAPAGPSTPTPHAAFTSNCTNLSCTFDGSGSNESGGSIATYAWDFGDGNTQAASASPTASHSYNPGGSYQVKLTVTDGNHVTDSVTHTVTPTAPGQNISFVGANAADAAGTVTSASATVPAAVNAGDTLLLFESHNSTSVTATTPSGWTKVGGTNTSNLTSSVYEKTATASDAGSSASVSLSAAAKEQVTVAAYRNVSTSAPIEAAVSSTATNTATHVAPALSNLTAGSWVVSLWADKSTTNSAWTAPASETQRSAIYGTSGGATSALVADSGTGVSGNYAAQTATTNVSSGSAAQWSIALTPSA